MNRNEIKKVLNELTADIDTIEDKKAVTIIKVLVNLVEMLVEENSLLREENQKLRDEINRLKGEQGVRHEVAIQTVATESHLYATYGSVSSFLPEHAIGVIRWCEASGTTKPRETVDKSARTNRIC